MVGLLGNPIGSVSRSAVSVIAPVPKQQRDSGDSQADHQESQRSASRHHRDDEREQSGDGQNRDGTHTDSLLPPAWPGAHAGPTRVFPIVSQPR